jgi:hypothetical protein
MHVSVILAEHINKHAPDIQPMHVSMILAEHINKHVQDIQHSSPCMLILAEHKTNQSMHVSIVHIAEK